MKNWIFVVIFILIGGVAYGAAQPDADYLNRKLVLVAYGQPVSTDDLTLGQLVKYTLTSEAAKEKVIEWKNLGKDQWGLTANITDKMTNTKVILTMVFVPYNEFLAVSNMTFNGYQVDPVSNMRDLCTAALVARSKDTKQSGSIQAFPKDTIITSEGQLNVGTMDSSIGEDGVSFATKSKIGSTIFAVCKDGDMCRVTGTVDSEDTFKVLKSISKVEKIK